MDADDTPQPYPLEVAREIFPPVWVVYDHPADFPGGYVVRVWYGLTPEPNAHGFETVDDARGYIVACGGHVPMDRADTDPPCVLEAWL
jgi:hypothetical protein